MDGLQLPHIIDTARLRLRPFRLEDTDDVMAYATQPEWSAFLTVPDNYQREDAELFLSHQILVDRRIQVSWAITFQGRVIGGVDVRFKPRAHLAEMGYSISPTYWRRGFASEAARSVIDVCFKHLTTLNRIRALADARNIASQRVLEKIGMRHEGTLRQNQMFKGTLIDEMWFGILRDEHTPTS